MVTYERRFLGGGAIGGETLSLRRSLVWKSVAVGVVLASVAAACGGDNKSSTNTTAAGGATTAAARPAPSPPS